MARAHWLGLRATIKNRLRALGLAIGRANPDSSLGSYLDLLFRHYSINCVLDVGGHFGEYGQFLRQNGYRGTIISFEPVPASFEILRRRAARDEHWHAYPWALGDENSERIINVPSHSDWASFLTTNQTAATLYGDEIQQPYKAMATIRRLDSIFADLVRSIPAPRLYLKLDTQGWELPILRGAHGCLDQISALQLEMAVTPLYEGAPTYLESLQVLSELDFALAALYRVGRLPNMQIDEFDCIMVRRLATAPTANPAPSLLQPLTASRA